MDNGLVKTFADILEGNATPEMIDTVCLKNKSYGKYQFDPVGFCEEELGVSVTEDVKEIMLSVLVNEVTIAVSCTGPGKTHAAAMLGIWFYKVYPESEVYTLAAPPEGNLKRLLWGEIAGHIVDHPSMFIGDTLTSLDVKRAPKNFITGVTIPTSGTVEKRESTFSGKHAPQMLFIVDEADAVPDEVFKGVDGCMSGGFTRLLCMFNPRQKLGAVYRMIRDKRANVVELSAFRHPNVVCGREVIPGAVNRPITVRRISQWCRPLAPGETIEKSDCFELPAFLVGAIPIDQKNDALPALVAGWYKALVPQFFYMVLGKYPPEGVNQLISRAWIDAARTRWDAHVAKWGEEPPTGVSAIMGLDCAEEGADCNVAIFRYGGWVERPITWNKVDMIVSGDRGAAEYRTRSVRQCGVDATGVGAGVAPHMRRLGCNAYSIKVAERPTRTSEMGDFKILRDQLMWGVREWLRADPGSMLPPDEELLEELATPYYKVVDGKIRVQKKDGSSMLPGIKQVLGRSPDKMDGLAMTFIEGMFPDGAPIQGVNQATTGGLAQGDDYPYA